MNCHGGNNKGQNGHENGHKGHNKHMLMMVLCCAIPVVLFLLLPYLKVNSPGLKSILPFAIFLLCPLMHILMIPMMFRGNKGKNDNQNGSGNHNDHHLHTRQIEEGKGEA